MSSIKISSEATFTDMIRKGGHGNLPPTKNVKFPKKYFSPVKFKYVYIMYHLIILTAKKNFMKVKGQYLGQIG